MIALFETQMSVIATCRKSGVPNLAPKGSLCVIDEETLLYAEGNNGKTLHNLQENPLASVMVVDRTSGNGYQFKGKTELLTGGAYFQKIVKRQEERNKPAPKMLVKIAIQEIYSLKPGNGGLRIQYL